ncbi:hypothetical protein [Caulobacter sp. BP25]|uniref:hypothetical protein n=1 Tax=Caulobacter sp. BP25 TaxID=2048900 RepID=UPI000C12DCED|nr:hypothetical protein [Caulobacter sp. BP25]PHY20918.1 hypothetical protein CSW59_06825 [Caulobacter sp. BP25]
MTAETPENTAGWVSQTEAVRLLAERGDEISQPALSQYLKKHPEVARQDQGPGKPTRIDFPSLVRSRATRRGRGPSSTPTPVQDLPLGDAPPLVLVASQPDAATAADAPASDPPPRDSTFSNELAKRKAIAETETAEFNARSARIRAQELEGRLIDKDVAQLAFQAAGVALMRAMEDNRRRTLDDIRVARDGREADQAMRKYETTVRAAFASALSDLALAADPVALAAQ